MLQEEDSMIGVDEERGEMYEDEAVYNDFLGSSTDKVAIGSAGVEETSLMTPFEIITAGEATLDGL